MLNIFSRLKFCLEQSSFKLLIRRALTNDVGGRSVPQTEGSTDSELQSCTKNILFTPRFSASEKELFLRDMLVFDDFLSVEEECSILNEIEPYLARMRYEFDHWDDAIHGFRETERLNWTNPNSRILDRVRKVAFPPGKSQLKHVHVLDLSEKGYIKPHIDSVKFCGDTIAGLSLLSNCVMRLVKEDDKEKAADILLNRRSLYIMKDSARYDFTHEVLGNDKSVFHDHPIVKNRRISVICRSNITPGATKNPSTGLS